MGPNPRRRALALTLLCFASLPPLGAASGTAAGPPPAVLALGALPLAFEPNRGQHPPAVEFAVRGRDHAAYLERGELVLGLRGAAPLRLRLDGSRRVAGEGAERLAGTVNVFRGADPNGWRTAIPTFSRVRYPAVYPGIDLEWHGRGARLEADFMVAPGADPAAIGIAWEGARAAAIDAGGDLVLEVAGGVVRQRAPLAWQQRGAARQPVEVRYRFDRRGRVRFDLGDYDRTLPLVIDPVIDYATYLGGGDFDSGLDVAVDAAGDVYLTGSTWSDDFPTAGPPYQGASGGGFGDVFVAKLGGSDGDRGNAIAVDDAGNSYLTGRTESSVHALRPFPVTPGVFQPTAELTVAFVAKISRDATQLLYSSYLGALSEETFDVAVDCRGRAWVTGEGAPPAYPFVDSTYPCGGPNRHGFLTAVSADGSALEFSTCFSPTGGVGGRAVRLDGRGHALVTGEVIGGPMPPVAALQPVSGGGSDGFLVRYGGVGCEGDGGGGMIFEDGLESGDLGGWSAAVP